MVFFNEGFPYFSRHCSLIFYKTRLGSLSPTYSWSGDSFPTTIWHVLISMNGYWISTLEAIYLSIHVSHPKLFHLLQLPYPFPATLKTVTTEERDRMWDIAWIHSSVQWLKSFCQFSHTHPIIFILFVGQKIHNWKQNIDQRIAHKHNSFPIFDITKIAKIKLVSSSWLS